MNFSTNLNRPHEENYLYLRIEARNEEKSKKTAPKITD